MSDVSVTTITGGRPTYPARTAMTGMTDYDSMQCRAQPGVAEAMTGRIPKLMITRGENGYCVEVRCPTPGLPGLAMQTDDSMEKLMPRGELTPFSAESLPSPGVTTETGGRKLAKRKGAEVDGNKQVEWGWTEYDEHKILYTLGACVPLTHILVAKAYR